MNDIENPLTSRQQEVLQLVARGKSNHEIALALVITENTVENHLRPIYKKLGVTNRAAAVSYALCKGWISWTEDDGFPS